MLVLKLTSSTSSQLVYSVSCGFLGYFPLSILGTDSHIVSGCRGSHFESTSSISHFCLFHAFPWHKAKYFLTFLQAVGQVGMWWEAEGQTFQNSHSETEGLVQPVRRCWKVVGNLWLLFSFPEVWDRFTEDKLAPEREPKHLNMQNSHAAGEEPYYSQWWITKKTHVKILLVGLWKTRAFLEVSLCFSHELTWG